MEAENATVQIIRKHNIIKTADKLLDERCVESVKHKYGTIWIKFKSGLEEAWSTDRIGHYFKLPYDPLVGKAVPIRSEVVLEPFDTTNKHLFLIKWQEWHAGSFYERRLSIHRLITQIILYKWQVIQYQHKELTKDLTRLGQMDPVSRHACRRGITLWGKYGRFHPSFKLAQSLTDWPNYLAAVWSDSFKLHRSIYYLLLHKISVTRDSLIRKLNSFVPHRCEGKWWINPNVYRTLLRRFKLTDMVLADPYPGLGYKLLASVLEGCTYHAPVNFSKLAEFIGASPALPLDRKHYDCALLDNNFLQNINIVHDLEYWIKIADYVLLFVHHEQTCVLPAPSRRVSIINPYSSCDQVYLYE